MTNSVTFKRAPGLACTCSICYDETVALENPFVSHGKCEAFHINCLKIWLEIQNTCPLCRKNVDSSSLFSWTERAIKELKLMKNDALIGVVGGVLAGLTSIGLASIGGALAGGALAGGALVGGALVGGALIRGEGRGALIGGALIGGALVGKIVCAGAGAVVIGALKRRYF